jgi:glycerophosphoryl diester phosphodiesterase
MDWKEFLQTRAQRQYPLLIAHRGANRLAPENSLAAFAIAQSQEADVLETDLHVTRDGEIVLFHDHTLERMSDGHGPLFAQSLAELKQWRLRGPDGQLTNERIPTLIELLTATQGEMPLLLELKDWRFVDRQHAERLVRILADYGVLAKCAIISFNQALIRAVRQVHDAIPVGTITLANPIPRAEGQLLGPFWPLLWINPAYVAWAHRMGRIVAPLDTTPEQRMDAYLRMGVDAVMADDPASVLAAMQRSVAARQAGEIRDRGIPAE